MGSTLDRERRANTGPVRDTRDPLGKLIPIAQFTPVP